MPVTAVSADFINGHVIPAHSHDLAQLLYAIEGVLVIETSAGRWVVPPSRGVWLKASISHTVRMRGAARMRSIFVLPDAIPGLLHEDCVMSLESLAQGQPGDDAEQHGDPREIKSVAVRHQQRIPFKSILHLQTPFSKSNPVTAIDRHHTLIKTRF